MPQPRRRRRAVVRFSLILRHRVAFAPIRQRGLRHRVERTGLRRLFEELQTAFAVDETPVQTVSQRATFAVEPPRLFRRFPNRFDDWECFVGRCNLLRIGELRQVERLLIGDFARVPTLRDLRRGKDGVRFRRDVGRRRRDWRRFGGGFRRRVGNRLRRLVLR